MPIMTSLSLIHIWSLVIYVEPCLCWPILPLTANRTRHPQLSLVSPVQVVEHCHLVYIIVYAILLIAFEESRFVVYLLFRPSLQRTANIEFLWFWFPPISIFLTALVRRLPTGSFLGQSSGGFYISSCQHPCFWFFFFSFLLHSLEL